MSELLRIVSELINSHKEGVYWDFKQEHHKNTSDLVHDITCLANADHDGDRYLIYGVNNKYEVIGCESTKTQANIIDTLRGSSFADGIFPDITLEDITINNFQVQALTIRATNKKPYYLSRPTKNGEGTPMLAHHIYTRTMDTNTPRNDSANSKQIEKMWKERFGLTQTPLEKFKLYLNDAESWEQDDEHQFHYKPHPEFTIREKPEYTREECHRQEWARSEVGYHYADNDDGATSHYEFYYFGTKLSKCFYCIFDGHKKCIVNPDWKPIGDGRVYYYLKDSLEYHFHCFMSKNQSSDDSQGLNKINSSQTFAIPIFESEKQLEDFLSFSKRKLNIERNHFFTPQSEETQNRLFYELLDIYTEFTNQEEINT